MSDKIKVPKGLAGVIADVTTVSKVMPETNSLTYRGYAVQDLCEKANFMQSAYLMVHGELPTQAQYNDFVTKEKNYRSLSADLQQVISLYPKNAHPMDFLRTGVSFLGMEDERIWDNSKEADEDKFLRLLAKIPTIAAYSYRKTIGEDFIAPDSNLDFAENFFNMCFGKIPAPEVLKAFDVSMILYQEHSFNASTFTSRVITSTTSDMYSAVVGGIGALKGPLHGGANEMVMHMMKEIDESEMTSKEWMLDALAQKKKVMGFGHRVYRNGDSRVPTMHKYAQKMAEFTGGEKWMTMYAELRQTMLDEKGIYPNLDFPAGPAYYMMGFPIDFFTPIFVMSRITGWCAHIMEQAADNRIIRPLSDYVGVAQREVTTLEERG